MRYEIWATRRAQVVDTPQLSPNFLMTARTGATLAEARAWLGDVRADAVNSPCAHRHPAGNSGKISAEPESAPESGPRMKPQQILPELTAPARGKSVLGSHTAKVLQTDDHQHRLQ